MDDWSDFNYDMLVLIAKRFNLIEDYLNFASVCKSWRCAATKENFNTNLARVPWLMLAEEEGNSSRQLVSPYNGMIMKKKIPKASGKRCMETMGWLVTVGKDEVDGSGRVLVCDIESNQTQVVAQLARGYNYGNESYIVESLGTLFIVVREGLMLRYITDDIERIPLTLTQDDIFDDLDGELTYGTTNIDVFEVDLVSGKLTQTKELGDTAFFIGHNASRSVQPCQFPGIKPNHIYFTDDYWESYLVFEEGGGLDMGVFNLADGTILPFPHYKGVSLSLVCPPT
ncbi:hypothetical protein KY284_018842 [Solanum tuberosum]|uniref:Ubiquitin-protein ligase n=1 Tax=Solanum tuberosum TaxID=4113 RepID=M1DST7_SOLTU|nr:hypothetical protein KY284_018842 [Solanum tuberosum]